MEYDCDVVIVGASFAGLSVASKLRGAVLLIDKDDLGAHQTSACGAPYDLIRGLGCGEAALRVLNGVSVEVNGERLEIKLKRPYCTLDYRRFCRILFERTEADFVKATVRSLNGSTVLTEKGEFRGRCIVDCSGWQAVVARSLRGDFLAQKSLAFGLETVVDYDHDALGFYLDERVIPQGVGWVFPIEGKARVGVASYMGRTKLRDSLEAFLHKLGLRMGDDLHGGFIPYRLRDPVVGDLFVVGDAAGQALPLTAEGIRPSIEIGRRCGAIIQRIIDGEISLREGLAEYRRYVLGRKRYYNILLWQQEWLLWASDRAKSFIVRPLSARRVAEYLESKYNGIFGA